MATLAQQEQYLTDNLPFAESASASTGLPVDFLLGQSALETGWGSNGLNNPGGISSASGTPNSFASLAAGWESYAQLLTSPNYAGVSGVVSQGPSAIASYLADQGYNSVNPNYASSVGATTNSVDNILTNMGVNLTGFLNFMSGNIPQGSATSPAVGNAQSQTSAAQANAGALSSAVSNLISNSLGRILIIVIGVILLIGAVIMFAKDQGVELPSIPAVPVPV